MSNGQMLKVFPSSAWVLFANKTLIALEDNPIIHWRQVVIIFYWIPGFEPLLLDEILF